MRRTPHGLALIDGDRRVSFGELEQRANRLARHLRECGVARESLVGLCLPRSATLVEAMLATLKAGGAYVPLDPEQPPRAAAVLRAARPALVLTNHDHLGLLPPSEAIVIVLDDPRQVAAIDRRRAEALTLHDPDRLAHVLFTSGSTGRPKGVLGTHRNELDRLAWMHARYPWGRGEVGCLKTALSFIDCFSEIFWPLPQGAPLVCAPTSVARDPRQLVALLGTHGVTRLCAVPSLLAALCEGYPDLGARLPRLRKVFSCGEPLQTSLARELLRRLPGCRLFNLYGSTETTADVTCCEVDAALLDRCGPMVPIGRPISGMEVQIVDEAGTPQPAGVAGELWVRGAGVARGYLARPGLGAEGASASSVFVDGDPPTYRTGDRGRLRDDGLLEVLGRVDQQLKIRGHRVEAGEVEAALLAREDVREAVVLLREDQQLVAYLVASPERTPPAEATLASELGQRLPDYMVPVRYVVLERLPRGPSGKIDRAALPRPPEQQLPSSPRALVVVPGDGRQARLLEIWRRVLGRQDIGLAQSFFALGGDSLSALKMLLAVETELGVSVSQVFFEQPTIEHLAWLIDQPSSDDVSELVRAPTLRDRLGTLPLVGPRLAALVGGVELERDPMAERVALWLRRFPEKIALAMPYERGLALLRWSCVDPRARAALHREQLAIVEDFFAELAVADPDHRRRPRALLGEVLGRRFEKATKRQTSRAAIAAALEAKGQRFWRPFTELVVSRESSPPARAALERCYRLEGVEELRRAQRRGRGVIVLSYHLSLFRLSLPALYHLGFERVELAAFGKRRVPNDRQSDDPNVEAEHLASATALFTRGLYTTLAAGGMVLMAGEGRKGRAHVEGIIGGRRYRLRAGFADLALRSGAVVVPMSSALGDDGRIQLRFHPPIPRGSRDLARRERASRMVLRFADFVDAQLRQAPESLSLRRMAYHLSLPRADS